MFLLTPTPLNLPPKKSLATHTGHNWSSTLTLPHTHPEFGHTQGE